MTDWQQVSLGEIGTWYGGGTPSKTRTDYWNHGHIPWLSPKDMGPEVIRSTKDHITDRAIHGSAVKLVPPNSVAVVVRSGILERTVPVAIVPFETTLNQDMKAIVARNDVDPRWLAWGLRAKEHQILVTARKAGTTVASLETARLQEMTLPLPPLQDQRDVIEVLEHHLSRLDAADQALRRSAERLAGLDALYATNYAYSSGGPLTTLEALATLITDGDHNPPKRVAFGVPHVTAKGIRPDGTIDLEAGTYLSPEGFAQTSKRYTPIADDVIVTCVGTVGRVAIVPKGITFSADRNLAAIRISAERARPGYVAMVLRGVRAQQYMQSASGATAQPHLYLRDLRALKIPVPSLDEQDRLLLNYQIVASATRRLHVETRAASVRSLAVRRAILAAAFRGELTTTRGLANLV